MENVIRYRRELHQIPEVGFCEVQTAAYIREHLSKLSCSWEAVGDTGTIAFFNHGAGEAIAFRADIDALSIAEETGLPFASQNGCMHACGHDAHMAMLLALADHLSAQGGTYRKNILLIFQPAEEMVGTGGAKQICDAGILERFRVTKIFGLHVWPQVKAGTIAVRPGPLMAQAANLELVVRGKSSHCARPDLGIDALAALADMISELNRYKREDIPVGTEYLLHLGTISGGDAGNIVCQNARAEGNIRAFDPPLFDALCQKVQDTAAEIDRRYGTMTEVRIGTVYPPVFNDAALVEAYKTALTDAGIEVLAAEKTMISEDFSRYQQRVSGVFAFLGLGDVPALHNNRFDFNEELMRVGVRAFIALLKQFA
ncbi:MAG: amidohydrolase [Oscillibacter sp.]|nr:amidohydrolase [Oscillibacter sp.]